MEYAAVFILFSIIAGSAVRLCVTGKGWHVTVACIALLVALCIEPVGTRFKIAPAALLLASAGVFYVFVKKDVTALFCALTVAAINVLALLNADAGYYSREWGYFCAVALCAVVCRPYPAAAVMALGCVLGDAYSIVSDRQLILRADVFSADIAYAAIFCAVAAFIAGALLSASEKRAEEYDRLLGKALYSDKTA